MSIKLGYEINNGKISRYLLTPNNIILLLSVRCLGRSGVAIVQSVVILSLCGLFYIDYLSTTPNLLYLLILFVFTSIIKIMVEIMVGFLAFWFVEIDNFVDLYRKISVFLSGNIIPLLLIPNIGTFLIYNPFSIYFYHPMQIYLNQYNNNQISIIIALAGFGSVLCIFLAHLMLRLGLKKNESVGL